VTDRASGDVPPVKYCGAPTETGELCRQVVGIGNGSGRCIWHDPARSAEASAVRRKGAEAANARDPNAPYLPPPPEPKTLADVIAWHSWIAVTMASGQTEKAVGTGVAYNLTHLRAALVSRDLEREVEELQAQVATLRQKRGMLN
jgi:hypothetical protein